MGADQKGYIARYISDKGSIQFYGKNDNVLELVNDWEGKVIWVHVGLQEAEKLLPALYRVVASQRVRVTIWALC